MNKKIGLFINTSQKENQIFLIDNFKVVEKFSYFISDNLENQFIDNLEEFLKKINIEFDDFGFLAVFCGPGGFTGTRIAIAFTNAVKLVRPELDIFDLYDNFDDRSIIERIKKPPAYGQLQAKYYKEPSITKKS